MGNDHQIKINFKNDNDKNKTSFNFPFNDETTFNDALDYISYKLPSYNICPCFDFHYYKDSELSKIDKNSKIIELNESEITINSQNCKCSKIFKKYFKKSKIEIINDLNEKDKIIEKKEKEIQNLNSEIKKLKLESDSGVYKMDPTTNQFIGNKINNQKNYNFDFYDVVIGIKSIKDITKGWEVKMNERGKKNYEKFKKKDVIKIGVIGNANKGKSFLLSKISKIKLPSGTSIRTEGLSIKYPEIDENHKNRNLVLLDSAGLETPVLKEEDEKIDNLKDFFKEKSREKLITEYFLQNYIIYNSDILIIVVGPLTYSEQKLLNKIKTELQKNKINKTLFIIHNLKTYTTKAQVEEYIKSFLLKSVTFKLKEHKIPTTQNQVFTGKIYHEIKDEQKNESNNEQEKELINEQKNLDSNNEQKILHFIFANEGSEAGDYYNNLTLYYIEHSYQQIINIHPFDVISTIKERFINISKNIIEKKDNSLKIENFDNKNNKLIKLNVTNGEIYLKRCLIDELGFANLKANGFEPTYNYYIKDYKINIRIEAPGNCDIINCVLESSGEVSIIRIEGIKNKDKEPAKIEDNLDNKREFGEFSIDIYLYSSEFKIDNKNYIIKNDFPKIYNMKGVLIIEYSLEEKKIFRPVPPNNDKNKNIL